MGSDIVAEQLAEREEVADRERASFRRLGKDATIYTVSVLLSRIVSIIMLPVYTRYLTPGDYGVLQLLDMTVDIAAIFLTAGVTAGTQRFYFKAESETERNRVVATAFILGVGCSLLVTLTLTVVSPWVWSVGFNGAGSPTMVRVAAVNFLLNGLSAVPILLMVMRQKPKLAVVASLMKLVLQLSFNIAFVVGLKLGPMGILLSNLLAGLLVGGLLGGWLLREVGATVSRSIARDLFRFGLPYQITFAGSFIMTFGDRFFLNASHGVTVVGLYSLSYQFGFILSTLTASPFLTAWEPQMYKMIRLPAAERNRRYNKALFFFSFIQITGAIGMALVVPVFLRVMTTPAFFAAADVVPIILVAYVLQSWTFLLKFGIDVSEKTVYFSFASWLSVAVTVVLYALLIPRWGAYGAAWGTVGGFAVRLGCAYRWAQRLWPIGYTWGRVAGLVTFGTVAVLLMRLVHGATLPALVAEAVVGFSLYFGLVWFLVLSAPERLFVREALMSPRQAFARLMS